MTTPQAVTVLTLSVTPDQAGQPVFDYESSSGTIDIANVIAYYQFVDPSGTLTLNTGVLLAGTGLPLVIDMSYAAFDAIVNP